MRLFVPKSKLGQSLGQSLLVGLNVVTQTTLLTLMQQRAQRAEELKKEHVSAPANEISRRRP